MRNGSSRGAVALPGGCSVEAVAGCCLGNGSLSAGERDDSLGANFIRWMNCGGFTTSAVNKKPPKKLESRTVTLKN